jgi:D-amino-acid dehydrogenase
VSDIVPLCVPGAVRKELFSMLHPGSPLFIRPTFEGERIRWLLRFAGMCRADYLPQAMRARAEILHSSALLFDELSRNDIISAEYEQRGVLLVFRTESAMRAYGRVNARLAP